MQPDNTQTEKYITMGVDSSIYESGCANSTDLFYNCDLVTMQLAFYWIALLSPPGYKIRARLYDGDEDYDNIFDDMASGELDVFPFEISINDSEVQTYQYYWTTPVTSTDYALYSSIRGIRETTQESPVRFLISPFTRNVWICAGISAALSFLVAPFLNSHPRHQYYAKHTFLIVEFTMAYLCALYSSRLKALVAHQSTSIPFQNLYELATKIETGKLRLVLEDKQTMRWNILAQSFTERSPPFQTVYNAIQRRGLENAILFEPNMTKICTLMDDETEYVFFAYDELIFAHCGKLCVWRYDVTEYPQLPVTMPVSKRSPVVKNADLFVHALANYRHVLIERRFGAKCVPERKESELIGIRSISGAAVLCGVGLFAGAVTLCVERTVHRMRSKRTTHM